LSSQTSQSKLGIDPPGTQSVTAHHAQTVADDARLARSPEGAPHRPVTLPRS
jgi:hypothetical protein